jgi:hypothetical protein
MAGQYAKGTTVDASASRHEIERTLTRYGATAFGYAVEDTAESSRAAVSFVAHGRQIRMLVTMPSKTERRFTHTPSRGVPRSKSAALAEWEQAGRQKWRALVLLVKALLESVESGIVTFEEVFLPFTIIPGTGRTVSEQVLVELEIVNRVAADAARRIRE